MTAKVLAGTLLVVDEHTLPEQQNVTHPDVTSGVYSGVDEVAVGSNRSKKPFIIVALLIAILLLAIVAVLLVGLRSLTDDTSSSEGSNVSRPAGTSDTSTAHDEQVGQRNKEESSDVPFTFETFDFENPTHEAWIKTNYPDLAKYYEDPDGDGIPSFIEQREGKDPNLAECMPSDCEVPELEEYKGKDKNVLIILDSSGSMAGMAGSVAKMQAAKAALSDFVDQIKDDDVNIALMVYGHKGSNSPADKNVSCQGIELMYDFSKPDPDAFNQAIQNFNPTGWTPIADSLKLAKSFFEGARQDQYNQILLISDGIETCGGDPIAVAKDLKDGGLAFKIDVIGLGVSSSDAASLRAIASAGGGDYYDAKYQDDLQKAFTDTRNTWNITLFGICNDWSYSLTGTCLDKLNVFFSGFDSLRRELFEEKYPDYFDAFSYLGNADYQSMEEDDAYEMLVLNGAEKHFQKILEQKQEANERLYKRNNEVFLDKTPTGSN